MSDVDEFEVEYVAGLAKQVEQLEARNKELEGCMTTPRAEDLTTIEQLQAKVDAYKTLETLQSKVDIKTIEQLDREKINLLRDLSIAIEKVEQLEAVIKETIDDLLVRGDIGRRGERVVNLSASVWERLNDAVVPSQENTKP
jgi:hypothetical protein